MDTLLQPGAQREFRRRLLRWYRKHGRHDMPWRKTTDPYAIVVSEFMLQQTTVATVRPYFDRFMKRFPTLTDLANADLNDVLALWSGLGYYARARNLWSAMKAVASGPGATIPSTPEELEQLPGIGPYTAGAIASFAFNKPASVLDGNIIRVFMRVLGIEDDPKLAAAQLLLRKTSFDLCKLGPTGGRKANGPRDLNLALMDLGSTVCLPQSPKCDVCPVASQCLAKAFGKQDQIPAKTEKSERPRVRKLHAIVVNKGRWLLGRRPDGGLFGGLWEFPGIDAPNGREPVLALEDAIKAETGLSVRVRRALPAFEHQLTHRIFTVRSFVCALSDKTGGSDVKTKGARYVDFRWISPANLSDLGTSAITHRVSKLAVDATSSEK